MTDAWKESLREMFERNKCCIKKETSKHRIKHTDNGLINCQEKKHDSDDDSDYILSDELTSMG